MNQSRFVVTIAMTVLWLAVGVTPARGQTQSLYVVDTDQDAVLKFDGATGAPLGTFASAGGGGLPAWMTCSASANLLMARQLAHHVVEFHGTTGALIRTFASTGLNNPTGLALAPNGNVLVSSRDSAAILEFDGSSGALVRTFASGGDLALGPFALAFGPNGNLFVATGHFAGAGFVLDYDGTSGAFVRRFAAVSQPRGLVFGPNGNLFVAVLDRPDAVFEFDGAIGGTPVRAFTGSLTHPHGVTFGSNGNLFVADTQPGRVVEFDVTTATEVGTFVPSGAGLGNLIDLTFGPSIGPCGPQPTTRLTVTIDIKPGSSPNSINPRSVGKIAVAVLTTATFDAATIDSTTVRFGVSGTEAAPVQSALEDVDKDGKADLIVHFSTRDTGIACGDTSALLTGATFGGGLIQGRDSINTVGCRQ